MQVCSVVATPRFFADSNPPYPSEEQQEELLSLPRRGEVVKIQLKISVSLRKLPSAPEHSEENAIDNFPLVLGLQRLTCKELKHGNI